MNYWKERKCLYCLPFPSGYPLVCDSQTQQSSPLLPGSAREASQLEREHVHRVYEEIAGHFSSTRHTPWPRIVDFLKALPSGSLVADVGCGNGKYLGINQDLYMVSHFASGSLCFVCYYHLLPSARMLFFRSLMKSCNQQMENL